MLIASSDKAGLESIEIAAASMELAVEVASDVNALLQRADSDQVELVLLDSEFSESSGLQIYKQIAEIDQHLPVVIVASRANSREAIEATKLGAMDYLVRPLDEDELRRAIARALDIRKFAAEPVALNPESPLDEEGDAMIGQCLAMQDVYKSIGRVAGQSVSVLVRGESGTGKELVARAIFQFGSRSEHPFMAINCAAIPDALLESELFGHEKGSFTGADKQRIGKFEQCDNGTLFLDEIGDMSMVLQGKLLRVLQEQSFERVGGNDTISTNVRLISATHRNLEEMVASGQFRGDLYYRLNGYTIELPPLREREGDLIYLLEHFRQLSNEELNKSITRFSPESIQKLRDYHWPGNVREFQSVIHRAVLQTTGKVVIPDFLPKFGLNQDPVAESIPEPQVESSLKNEIGSLIQQKFEAGETDVYDTVIQHVERQLITQVLEFTLGNQVEASKTLGITRTTLRTKIKKLGVQIKRSIATRAESETEFENGDDL